MVAPGEDPGHHRKGLAFEKQQILAGLVARIFVPCPPVLLRFSRQGLLDVTVSPEVLATDLPGLIEQCRCQIDLPAARALLFAMLGPEPGHVKAVAVQMSLAPAGQTQAPAIPLAADTPWSEAFRAVVAAAHAPGVAAHRLQVR